jgi:hypothetical protein
MYDIIDMLSPNQQGVLQDSDLSRKPERRLARGATMLRATLLCRQDDLKGQ